MFIIESAYDGQNKSCSSWCEHAENVVDEVNTWVLLGYIVILLETCLADSIMASQIDTNFKIIKFLFYHISQCSYYRFTFWSGGFWCSKLKKSIFYHNYSVFLC